ncbi:hypothetical protein ACFY9F_38195 [Streptomyces sp. NPDC012421]|uniref:hypothetical protein n=1 Tax=Streptomyces sp. NPDC012421 TaxID=3364832 RepID=UPI0036E90317
MIQQQRSRRYQPERYAYDDIRDAMVNILEKEHGITTSRYHGRPFRQACHLIHQDNLQRRKPGGRLPECHPNFGKSERDVEGHWDRCDLSRDMPRFNRVGVDHEDAWWRGNRIIAYVWYPYEVPLVTLGKIGAKTARHGLELNLDTGWGAHYYGNTPALILTPAGAPVPHRPRTEDLIRAARALPHLAPW